MLTNSFSKFLLIILSLVSPIIGAQSVISVDVNEVLSDLSNKQIGLNMNYLTDDGGSQSREQTIKSLSSMGVNFLRFPGGEKSDNYLWSVPPYDKSRPHFARTEKCEWPSNDPDYAENDFSTVKESCLDFDEFMSVCKGLNAEPLIVVAYDAMYKPSRCGGDIPTKEQLLRTAEEWVRYANVTKGYGVKYWMIGNESWNKNAKNGYASDENYRDDVIEFSTRMKAVDNTIKIIANGNSNPTWWKVILPTAAKHIDYLGISNYPVRSFIDGYSHYLFNPVPLSWPADSAILWLDRYAPEEDRDRLKIISTEYNSHDLDGIWPGRNDLGHALVSFEILGEHLLNKRIEGAYFWNTRWVNTDMPECNSIDANGNLKAAGKALSLWGNNLRDKMVQSSGPWSMKTYASYSESNKGLTLFIINKHTGTEQVNISLSNYSSVFAGNRYELSGSGIGDTLPEIKFRGRVDNNTGLAMTLPPTSVTMLTLNGDHFSAIANVKRKGIKVMNNPAQDLAKFEIPDPISKVNLKVFSVDGKLVEKRDHKLIDGKFEVNVSDWQRGFYILSIQAGENDYRVKLAVN